MRIKENITLILGLVLPILTIAVIIALIYIPRYTNHPQYSFVYIESYDYYQSYIVRNGKIVYQDLNVPPKPVPSGGTSTLPARFFVYDTKEDKETEITFEQAQMLSLYDSQKSPDGYEIINGENSPGLFFNNYQIDRNSLFIVGHGLNKKLNIHAIGNNFYGNLVFLGWIK
ncbi:MAG: hypothetical protein PHG23_00205 [Candidatus Pacebacteria bacterium]|nr:hypothetical protein [Candidatus Paceibacterota bacterium]